MRKMRFLIPLLLVLALLLCACADPAVNTPTSVPVTGVELAPKTLTLAVGGEATLSATVLPENATDKAVSFSSSNTAVATVDGGGKLKALAAGTATVTVTTKDGAKTATCEVTVVDLTTLAVLQSEHYTFTVPMMSYLIYNTYYGWVNTYSQAGYLPYIFGEGGQALNTKKPLREQFYSITQAQTVTWFDYFAALATNTATELTVLCEAALANGMALGAQQQETINSNMQMLPTYASSAGYASVNAFLAAEYGETVTEDTVRAVMELSQLANLAAGAKTAELENAVTPAYLEAYYAENASELDKYADLIVYTFPAQDSARASALAATTSAEAFCTLLLQYCTEAGMSEAEAMAAVQNAVYYDFDVTVGNTDLEDWLRDEREAGDTHVFTDLNSEGSDTPTSYTVCYLIAPPHRDERRVQHVGHILFMDSTYRGLTTADTLTGATKALAERLLANGVALTAENMAKELVVLMREEGALTAAENAAGNTIYTIEKSVFQAYGTAYTEDGNVFYNDVKRGDMVAEFDAWLYHPQRTVGEISPVAVKTTYGYHVMYYGGEGDAVNWELVATEAALAADYEAWFAARVEATPLNTSPEQLSYIN